MPPPENLPQMQSTLSRLTAQVEALADETARRLDENPPLSVLPDIEIPWLQIRPELTQRKEQLAKLGKQLDGLTAEIAQLANDAEQVRAALVGGARAARSHRARRCLAAGHRRAAARSAGPAAQAVGVA